MNVALGPIGLALPRVSVPQDQLAEAATRCGCTTERQRRILRRLYHRSGIEARGCAILDPSYQPPQEPNHSANPANPTTTNSNARHIADRFPPSAHEHDRGPTLAQRMALYRHAAPDLARRAAQQALHLAGLDPAELAHLVTVSCTGFAAPGVDLALFDQLGLRPDTSRTHVGFMGCHAALNGLDVADALVARTQRPALLVCVEICTAHFRYGHEPPHILANALFADGAAAVVLQPQLTTTQPATPAPAAPLRLIGRRSVVLAGTGDAMTWQLGDHGFEMTLQPHVPQLIHRHLADALLPWLASLGHTPASLAGVAIHPGGPRILDAALDALQLPPPAGQTSRDILAKHGNMSSPTILFILDRLRNATHPPAPTADIPTYLALAFGPGLTLEARLLG